MAWYGRRWNQAKIAGRGQSRDDHDRHAIRHAARLLDSMTIAPNRPAIGESIDELRREREPEHDAVVTGVKQDRGHEARGLHGDVADHQSQGRGGDRLLHHRVGHAEEHGRERDRPPFVAECRSPERMKPRKASSSQIAGSTAISKNGSQQYGADASIRSIDLRLGVNAVLQRIEFLNRRSPLAGRADAASRPRPPRPRTRRVAAGDRGAASWPRERVNISVINSAGSGDADHLADEQQAA